MNSEDFAKKFKHDFIFPIFHNNTVTVKQTVPSLAEAESAEPLGTGTTVWPCAVALSKAILEGSIDVSDSTVVELGAGCGLCGLVAATMSPSAVLLTDLEFMQTHLEANIALNKSVFKCPVKASILDWNDTTESILPSSSSRIVLVGSDLLYREEDAMVLAKCIESLFLAAGDRKIEGHFFFAYHNRMAISMFIAALQAHVVRHERSADMVELTVEPNRKREREEEDECPRSKRRCSILPGMTAYEDAITASLFVLNNDSEDSSDASEDSDPDG